MIFLSYHDFPLISILLGIPLVGAIFVSQINEARVNNIQRCTLWIHLFAALFVGVIAKIFDPNLEGFQCAEKAEWTHRLGLHYDVAIDTISLVLMGVVTLLFPVTTALSQADKLERYKTYALFSLGLEFLLLGCLCANNLILFYLVLETSFFAAFFLLRPHSNDGIKMRVTLLVASSAVLMITFLSLSGTGASSFEIIRYETTSFPKILGLSFVLAYVLRMEQLFQHAKLLESQAQDVQACLLLFFGPIFVSQLILAFRMHDLVRGTVSGNWIQMIALIVIATSLGTLAAQKNRRKVDILVGLARSTLGWVLLAQDNNKAGLLITTTYTLGISSLFLLPLVQKNSEESTTRRGQLTVLALFGLPCACGFWGYLDIWRYYFLANQEILSAFILLLLSGLATIGCCRYNDVITLWLKEKRSPPVPLARVFYSVLAGLLFCSVFVGFFWLH